MSGLGFPCGHCGLLGHTRDYCPRSSVQHNGTWCPDCVSRTWVNGQPPRVEKVLYGWPSGRQPNPRGRGRGRGGPRGITGRGGGQVPPPSGGHVFNPPSNPLPPVATRNLQDFVHTISLSANTTNTTVTRLVIDETLAGLAAAVRGYELITMDSVWLELRISAQDTGSVVAYFANSRIGALGYDEIQNLSGSTFYTASNTSEVYAAHFSGGGRGSRHLLSTRRGQAPALTLFYSGATSAVATMRIHFRLALQDPVQVTNVTTPQVPIAVRGTHTIRAVAGFGGLWAVLIPAGAAVRINTSGAGAARTLQVRPAGGNWRDITIDDANTVATVGNFPSISALFAAIGGTNLSVEFYGNMSA